MQTCLETGHNRFLDRSMSLGPFLRRFMVACALIALLSATTAAANRSGQPSVRVRVYDYAAVPVDVLARAQDEVRHLYADIGVETTWLTTQRLSQGLEQSCVKRIHASDLSVIVLNASLTTRMAAPEGVLGMAATTPTAHGHLAYVFYDRLQNDSVQSHPISASTLAFVMAHEIGHLLLPYGSHSDAGVMRGRWSREALSRLDVRRLRFTPLQTRQIRQVLELAR
jgi:hypothetical protein